MSTRDRLVQWVGVCLLGGALVTSCSGGGADPTASGAGGAGVGGAAGAGGGGAVCKPGEITSCYEGAPTNTVNVGRCKAGERLCNADGSGYGACEGQVLPASDERCDTLGDDDCDGEADEGCPCMPGNVSGCYSAAQETQGVGACKGGTRVCNPDGIGFGPCEGEVTPAPENCATPADDDCDGTVNEDCTYTSCFEYLKANPGASSGTYLIDPDGNDPKGTTQVYCDMTTDDGGYTMKLVNDDPALFDNHDQAPYAAVCEALGLEIIVPRSPGHVASIYAFNNNQPANLYNVFPKFEGAVGIKAWKGICNGVECVPWVNAYKDDDTGCAGDPEPNGNNYEGSRLYRWNLNCAVEGGWDDYYNHVQETGWVICSTNDK
jgi:hypothetical protein